MIETLELHRSEIDDTPGFVKLRHREQHVFHPFLVNATVWANASKVVAIGGTALISYLGMRLWVFASNAQKGQGVFHANAPAHSNAHDEHRALVPGEKGDKGDTTGEGEQRRANENEGKTAGGRSLSVVLPAYNEEQVIASTISDVLDVLSKWWIDAEVLVVNDGSADRTGAIVAALALAHPQIRLITHSVNQGYGAALVSGFAAATKDLTLFMDADGQFDIRDLARLVLFIDKYDAVIGYRLQRQ
ncbi:MAG TPA: glycosyltransferase family 2 protein, partial [Ktedonobacteraceae bacterium]|nr:glycosyltransferase family 2 protein [Ktedonobacteraceae bacterium]